MSKKTTPQVSREEARNQIESTIVALSEQADQLRIKIQMAVVELQKQGRDTSADMLIEAMKVVRDVHKYLDNNCYDYISHADD